MHPEASVILATYNRLTYLKRALRSVLQQTYVQYEIIIVDDGSTDGTAAWVKTNFPDVNLIQLERNLGAAAARNRGIKEARGTYIAFLDSDDVWLPEYLFSQVQALKARPQALLTYCNYVHITPKQPCCGDPVLKDGVEIKPEPTHDNLTIAMLMGNFIHVMSQVVVSAMAFQRFGLLDERLKVCHDREFYLRLLRYGDIIHVQRTLLKKYWLPDSLVTQSECCVWLEDGLLLLEIFYSRPENHRYQHLRPQAEQRFRARVNGSQHYFSKAFAANLPKLSKASSSDRQNHQICAAEVYEHTKELWLITCYFNPSHYRTKFENYQRFKERIQQAGLPLLTIECAFGQDEFDLEASPDVLQVRAQDVMWQKERLLNLAIRQLPSSAKKVAWMDCDILFANPKWAVETARLLDEFPIVQPFTQSFRLPQDQLRYSGAAEMVRGGIAAITHRSPVWLTQGDFARHGHPGYAWAAQRSLLEKHGLYDAMIIGSADHMMAHAMYGDFASPCLNANLGNRSARLDHFQRWGEALHQDVQGRVGYVAGNLLHLWHGDVKNRQYSPRHHKLAQFQFDPHSDIQLSSSGLWEWASPKPELHEWVVNYFSQRQEDGIRG